MARSKRKGKQGRRISWIRWFLLFALSVMLIPVAQVVSSRWINPATTPEMVRFLWFSDSSKAGSQTLEYRWIPLESVPPEFIHLLWASEDQRFFQHGGIDFYEIRTALKEVEISGKKPRGASTITMQAARCLYLWQGRSWIRKGLEGYYTLLMEGILPKRRILELYINVIEFGDGIYGLDAAAEVFFHRPPNRLSKNELALIVAVMPSPRRWDPRQPDTSLVRRQKRVLRLAARSRFPWQEIEFDSSSRAK